MLVDISRDLREIKDDLKEIDTRLKSLEGSARNMDEHIGFVNRAYSLLRSPLNVLRRITVGENGTQLPVIKDKENDSDHEEEGEENQVRTTYTYQSDTKVYYNI